MHDGMVIIDGLLVPRNTYRKLSAAFRCETAGGVSGTWIRYNGGL